MTKYDKSRKNGNDSDVDSSNETKRPNGIKKANGKVDGFALPTIREIQVINPNTFESKKLKLDDEEESGGISRVGLVYKHANGERNFLLTCPNISDAFFRSNGVEEETYAKKGGLRTGTGKNVMKFYMEQDNLEHEKFHQCLIAIGSIVKKRIEKDVGKEVNVKIRGLYPTVDNAKKVTGYALAAKLIESAEGVVYTAAYDDEKQINVKSIGRCTARPAFSFSYTIPEDGDDYRISVSLAQVYAITKPLFPLRDLD